MSSDFKVCAKATAYLILFGLFSILQVWCMTNNYVLWQIVCLTSLGVIASHLVYSLMKFQDESTKKMNDPEQYENHYD